MGVKDDFPKEVTLKVRAEGDYRWEKRQGSDLPAEISVVKGV